MKSVDELGFSVEDRPKFHDFLGRTHGILLVTGPTGSGKTTTLYSLLKHLSKPELNIITIEDPIEMVQEEFNQVAVRPAIDLTFATALRTVLRQDPDIIMVGEIRDRETAEHAVQADLTGHLVLSTLHTNDAPSAVTRLLDLGIPHFLIMSTVIGIVAQRLVRVNCGHCSEQHTPTAEEAVAPGLPIEHLADYTVRRGAGSCTAARRGTPAGTASFRSCRSATGCATRSRGRTRRCTCSRRRAKKACARCGKPRSRSPAGRDDRLGDGARDLRVALALTRSDLITD